MGGVNDLNHIVMTHAVWDWLEKAGKEAEAARIVNVSSEAHRLFAPTSYEKSFAPDRFPKYEGKIYSAERNYGISKLGNIVFSNALQARLDKASRTDIVVNSCHPGVAATDLARNMRVPSFLVSAVKPFFNPAWFG